MQETWVWSSGLGRSPGEGKGYPLQYSGLENSCIVHGVAKSQTQLSGFFHFLSLLHIWSTGERWRWCGNEEIFRILMEFKRGSHYMNANGKCVNQCFLVSVLLPFWAHWLFALGTVLCTVGCRAAPLASTLLSVAQLKTRGTSSCLVATPEGFSDIFKHPPVGKVTCKLISISVNNSKKKTRRGIRMSPGPPLCSRKRKAVKET